MHSGTRFKLQSIIMDLCCLDVKMLIRQCLVLPFTDLLVRSKVNITESTLTKLLSNGILVHV